MTVPLGPRSVLFVRTASLSPEEEQVLAAARQRLLGEGRTVMEVCLGSSSYLAEPTGRAGSPSAEGPSAYLVLADDAKGRGLRLDLSDERTRVVTPEELVEALMAAEAVIQLP